MNYLKLRGKIRELYGTEKAFAIHLGMQTSRLSALLNKKAYFDQKTICIFCDELSIPYKEIGVYFFS